MTGGIEEAHSGEFERTQNSMGIQLALTRNRDVGSICYACKNYKTEGNDGDCNGMGRANPDKDTAELCWCHGFKANWIKSKDGADIIQILAQRGSK